MANPIITQCAGTTLKGVRCNMKTYSIYCRFHKNQAPQILSPNKQAPQILSPNKQAPLIEEEEICCVCTDPIQSILKPCGHSVHIDCVIKSGKQLCPLCRQHVTMTKIQKESTINYNIKYERERRQELMDDIRDNIRDQHPGIVLLMQYMADRINN
jgi:hypothetical protein